MQLAGCHCKLASHKEMPAIRIHIFWPYNISIYLLLINDLQVYRYQKWKSNADLYKKSTKRWSRTVSGWSLWLTSSRALLQARAEWRHCCENRPNQLCGWSLGWRLPARYFRYLTGLKLTVTKCLMQHVRETSTLSGSCVGLNTRPVAVIKFSNK